MNGKKDSIKSYRLTELPSYYQLTTLFSLTAKIVLG